MGGKSKQQAARKHNLSSGRTALAVKMHIAEDNQEQDEFLKLRKELNNRSEDLSKLKSQHEETLRELKKIKTHLDEQRQFIESCRQLGSSVENTATIIKPREMSDYHDLSSKHQKNRQQILCNLAIQSGLAKSYDGYQSLIRGALTKADQNCLEKMHAVGATSSDSEIEEEWLLSGLSSSQEQRKKQYITYSNEDKVFVLDSLIQCQSIEQISIGIKQLVGLYPKYFGLTARKIISWRKVQAGELKEKPGTKINKEFESDIWSRLVLCVLKETVDLTGKEPKQIVKAEVVINVTYSYEVVKTSAEQTQATEKWLSNTDIQGLKFSNR
jgi:hypothetical protein